MANVFKVNQNDTNIPLKLAGNRRFYEDFRGHRVVLMSLLPFNSNLTQQPAK